MFQIECPLCNKVWSSNSIEAILEEFYDHLSKHTKEEVQILKRLAELELKDPSAYQQLKESLMRLEYVMRSNRQ
jgi:hypothetical protein